MEHLNLIFLLAFIVLAFVCGLYVGVYKAFPYSQIQTAKQYFLTPLVKWDLVEEQKVRGHFEQVNTSVFNLEMDTIASLVSAREAPLIVSLHTWSGNYLQPDPIAQRVVELGFNYIHPNFQGPNNSESSCLSQKVISDIDSAIEWAIKNGSVDSKSIYVIGASGGGYTALGYASKSKFDIKHTFAWVPITDLNEWYWQSRNRGSKYADDILGCAGQEFNEQKLAQRSPINMDPIRSSKVTIYTGIKDGYKGSVPISHSINYFNKFAKLEDKINEKDVQKLLTQASEPTLEMIEGRQVFIDRVSGKLRLIVFDGQHEMLENAAIDAIC